ncbi:STAS domain-containing protein [Streptomyces sp. NPDC059076]|uniref:STAS domain-containing protein n=1 Tax=unclassified Streptomyces TaxID=2593676 RepID=UPI003687E91E
MSRQGTVLHHHTDLHHGHATVHVTGEIDLDSSPRLTAALDRCLRSRPQQVTVDLTGTTYCDCSGLGALLTAHARAAHRGVPLTVTGVHAAIVARVFAVTGTDQTLGII